MVAIVIVIVGWPLVVLWAHISVTPRRLLLFLLLLLFFFLLIIVIIILTSRVIKVDGNYISIHTVLSFIGNPLKSFHVPDKTNNRYYFILQRKILCNIINIL